MTDDNQEKISIKSEVAKSRPWPFFVISFRL